MPRASLRGNQGGASGRIVVLLLVVTGCSASSNRSLFPTGQYLLSSARRMSREAPQPAPVPRELAKIALPAYFLEPGDVVLVESTSADAPVRYADNQTVLVDGTIDLGKYGRLAVAGRTVEEVELQVQALVEAVERQRVDPINVQLVGANGAVYYVLGEVTAPGAFPLIGRETVLDGIITAGGLTDQASTCNVILSRPTLPDGCRVVLPVCYREIVQLGDTTTNYQLRPGDRIFVASRTWKESFAAFVVKGTSWSPCRGPQVGCADPNCAPWGPGMMPLPPVTAIAPLPEPLPPTDSEPLPPALPEASEARRR